MKGRGVVNAVFKLVYPMRCPACDTILSIDEEENGFCRKCRPKVRIVGNDYCLKCGKPLKGPAQEFCQDCKSIRHSFETNRSLYIYENDMKGAMYRFKYMNRRCYSQSFVKDIERFMHGYIDMLIRNGGIDAVIPIPMYKKKEKKRGYNQAKSLAKAIGEAFSLPVLYDGLLRVRETEKMKLLSPAERRRNLNNAFIYRQTGVKLNRILLVDDIYTTGATLDAASEALKRAGVRDIYSLCLCIGSKAV